MYLTIDERAALEQKIAEHEAQSQAYLAEANLAHGKALALRELLAGAQTLPQANGHEVLISASVKEE